MYQINNKVQSPLNIQSFYLRKSLIIVLTILSSLLPASLTAGQYENGSVEEKNTNESTFVQRFNEIRKGQTYSNAVQRGTFKKHHNLEGFKEEFYFSVDVPESYSPKNKIPLHIYLHGGVGFSRKIITSDKIKRLKRLHIEDTISVYPSAWKSAKWWYESQTKNITKIIETLKKNYNIDENKVFLHGISDGATGAYYYASHMPTPFAGFVALIGSPKVLSPKNKPFGTVFIPNFINKPIFSVNTRNDQLYPSSSVKPLFNHVNKLGGNVTFYSMSGNHDMNWFRKKKTDFRDFIDLQSRNPYPDSLRWQIDGGGEFPRIHWLVVNKPIDENKQSIAEVNKQNNIIQLTSINVSSVTLLISPDHFDLNKNIQIWSNKSLVFDKKVLTDINVLNKWSNIDRDRSMLFAAEIKLDLL